MLYKKILILGFIAAQITIANAEESLLSKLPTKLRQEIHNE